MSSSRRTIAIVAIVLAAVAVLWWTASRFYFGPRAELTGQITEARSSVQALRAALGESDKVEASIAAFADRTLGQNAEVVDHRLRSRLNRIAEEIGISGAVVNSGNVSAKPTPARSQFKGRWRELRDRVDFVELNGSISGDMSFAQVLELVDRIHAEPWLKHIDSVRVEPRSDGQHYGATVRLTTLFIPGRAPRSLDAPLWDAQRMSRYAQLLEVNPFELPAEAAPTVTAAPAEPPPAGFPWQQWLLTGVAEGPAGPEAWLRNTKSGETRQLPVGGALDEARLLAIGADGAEFQLGAQRFHLEVGSSFDDRSEVRE